MKGHEKVIELLNGLLTNELTAINQYFIHAKMCENWGFLGLSAKIRAESIDEMRHADSVISRILYLEGTPNLQRLGNVLVGESVPEQFSIDLDLEKRAIKFLNEGVVTARELGDHGTFELVKGILVDEEQHADWLETQLELIGLIGEAHYLAQQVNP